MPKLLDLLSLHTKPSICDGQRHPFVVNFHKDVIGSRRIRLLDAAWLVGKDTFIPGVTLSLLAADWKGR